jgi:hypothetical protein
MIDEAQHLRPEVLEQIRLLSNIDDAHGTILQIILVGQTDLERLMARPDLQQLQQRVSRRFALEPLNREEVRQYIDHRLALASGRSGGGGKSPGVEFTAEGVESVSHLSHGVPRVINLLCDRALELAFISSIRTIDSGLVQAAARGLGIDQARDDSPRAAIPGQTPAVSAAAPAAMAAEPEAFAAPESALSTFDTEIDPVLIATPQRRAKSDVAKYAALGLLAGVLAVAILVGFRRGQTATVDAPASPPPTAAAPGPSPVAAPPAPSVPAKPAPAPAGAEPPAGAAPAPVADSRFDIVVASFRTDARATSVADEVSALGVPVRRREADGWQQVVAGPFPSRTEAEQAQQRIHGAGLTGTQIVPSTR